MFKKFLSVMLSITMMLTFTVSVHAQNSSIVAENSLSEKYSLNIIDAEAAAEIDTLVAENSILQSKLSNSNIATFGVSAIQRKINTNNERIAELGGQAPSDELLIDLITAEMKQRGVQLSADWHPRELVDAYNSMYNMNASYATTYAGKTQYHLIFKTKGLDSHLHKIKTDHFYNSFSAGSSEARNWAQETIKIYAEKLIGTGLGLINPFLELIPYELLGLAAQPASSAISSSGNATIVNLNTTSIQKFVYVLSNSTSSWFFALSTNMVSTATTITQAVAINGYAHSQTETYDNIIYGDFNNANIDANNAFNAGYSNKTCINEVCGYSKSKNSDIITVSIFTPTYVAHMA